MRRPRNAPEAVQIEFVPAPLHPPRIGWLVLAVGLAAAGAAAMHLRFQADDLAARRAELAVLRELGSNRLLRSPPVIEDPAQAQAVVARLGADWGKLLTTLAQELPPGVKMLEVHGDAGRGTVRIVGEAPSLAVAFAYVERLQGRPGLQGFALNSHAWPQGANVGSLSFTASGRWGGQP